MSSPCFAWSAMRTLSRPGWMSMVSSLSYFRVGYEQRLSAHSCSDCWRVSFVADVLDFDI
jgi:hypothetical protein